jgi:hypothetical protein
MRMVRAGWQPLPQLLLFGLGDYLTFSVFSSLLCVVSGRNPLEAAVTGAIFVGLFLYAIRAVTREPRGRGADSNSRVSARPVE